MPMGTKIPRSQTVNEGMKHEVAASLPSSSSTTMTSTNPANKPNTNKSLLWGWLGFSSSEKSSLPTQPAAITRTRQTMSTSSPGTAGGSAQLRRWASLVSESPPGAEEFGKPSTSEPQSSAVVPDASSSVPSAAAEGSADKASASKRGAESSPKGSLRYEVGDRDTLQSIAVKLNVTVGEITKLNRFTTRILFPGQVINVPDPNYVPEQPPPPEPTTAQSSVEQPESKEQSEEQGANEADFECVEKFVKARALYLPNKSIDDAVPGMLLITPNAVMFDPNIVAALAEQQIRDVLRPTVSAAATTTTTTTTTSAAETNQSSEQQQEESKSSTPSSLPPGDLLLPMSWIASVTIFRQIPGAPPRTRIGSTPAAGSASKTKCASVTSIGEESESDLTTMSATDSAINLAESTAAFVPPAPPSTSTENAFDQSAVTQTTNNNNNNNNSTSTPLQATSNAISTTANKAVAAVSESASAIGEMSSQIAGAIGTPLKRISLGTLAKVEPAFTQSVEKLTDVVPLPTRRLTSSLKRALSLQSGSEGNLSDPAGPTSLFLRIIGTSSLTDDSLAALGIGSGSSTAVLTTSTTSASSRSNAYPEYWFRVPAKCANGLQHFFTHWNPELTAGTNNGQNNPPSTGQRGAGKPRAVGFRIPDNRSPDNLTESSYKEWEVISIDESIKRNQAEDAEIMRSLPLPEMQGKSTVLLDDYIRELCPILPPICIGATWTLLYSSVSDGFSLSSVFRAAAFADSPQLLVVQDLSGAVFGGVSSCQFHISDHFYGSSDCCLFSFFPTFRVFRWSGENNFFIKGNRESLCFGSANGVSGLWLDSELYRGRTQRCGTFDNDLLTNTEDFTIAAVELWGFPSS